MLLFFISQSAECKSEKHNTALNNGPAPWVQEATPAPEHGGQKKETSPPSQVTNKCTKVYGRELSDCSCSKMCLQ